jgi:thiosulfate/3-mercaptopyruvate sulfurtransferase
MYSHPYYPDALVSKEEISELVAGGTQLVQVDLDPAAYGDGHLPGAVSWHWETQLRNQSTQEILNKEEYELLLGSSGISRDTPVVLYGDNNNWFACWALWLMHLYGHENVRLLDGGLSAWLKAGYPLTNELPVIHPVTYVASEANLEDKASTEHIFGAFFDQETFCLLDVRSSAEYQGQITSAGIGADSKCDIAGHIPTAVNVPWNLNCNEDGTFKSPDELQRLYSSFRVVPEKSVITYCAIGERASLSWFVLKNLLGYPVVMNYDRSMAQWSRIKNAPVERSAA